MCFAAFCVYVCAPLGMCLSMRVRVGMCVFVCVCVYARLCVCMRVHVCVRVHVWWEAVRVEDGGSRQCDTGPRVRPHVFTDSTQD